MNPHRKTRSAPALRTGLSRPVQGGISVAALVIIPLLAIGGSDGFRAALDFTSGVLSLVSLTASVAWGLIATDRLLLSTRHRLLAQGIHRATAIASLGFLLLHGTVKVSLGHVAPIGALLPFGLGITGSSALIGFGSLAGLLMVVAASTGALRSTLAGRSRFAARWRPLHMLAYPAWCFALVHGLYAGRQAATWVVVMYSLALTGVATVVALRMLPAPTQRALAERFVELLASLEGRRTRPRKSNGADPLGLTADRADPATGPLGGPADTAVTGRENPRYEPPTVSAEWLDRQDRTSPGLPGGFSAAYRAVARSTQAPEPAAYATEGVPPRAEPLPYPTGGLPPLPEPLPYATDGAAPLAERIPLTEELPVVTDSPVRPGYWPAPSPPMPTYAAPPQASAYDTPPPMPTYAAPPQASAYDTPPPMPTYATPPPAGEPWTAPAGDRP
ncbi:hypothetical protein M5362_06235 [Streptomyces sp. Je 1-79]|uniref:hypothetical protein n=1 Tax=Streptomyces sp. Je 1-79 TaxID=2943847 RepID=UPI0021A55584|nr:hypothetical protein [Streptomyces sp. Je 1-79]MCT4352727.1 hypothetical protein [Streptomyces sp. Je 1-79]